MTSTRSTSILTDRRIHGLPGLPIAGPDGSTGRKGQSSYIGYLTEFFNVEYYLDPSYAYLRTKNEPEELTITVSESLIDGNVYHHKEIDNEVYGHEREIQLEKHMLYNIQQGPGGSAPDAYFMYTGFEENFFKYVRGDRHKIGEYRIHNAYNTGDDVPGPNQDVQSGPKLSLEFTDADGNPIPGGLTSGTINIGRIRLPDDEQWRMRQELMRPYFAKYMTSDVAVPVSLKDIYRPGDLLYILDNETDRIKYVVRLDDDMAGCTFERFLQQDMTGFGSILNDFRLDHDRVILNADGFTVAGMHTAGKVPGGLGFLKNFINAEKDAGMLSVLSNRLDASAPALTSLTGGSRNLTVTADASGFTVASDETVRLSSLSLRNSWTNVNVPEYNDDSLRLTDGLRCPGPGSADIYQENIGETSDVSVFVNMKYTKFFRSAAKGRWFGIRVYTAEGKKGFSFGDLIVERIAENGTYLTFDLTAILQELEKPEDGEHRYFVHTFIKGDGFSTRHSTMSELRIEWKDGMAVSRTLLNSDVSDPDPGSFSSSNRVEFIMDTIECGACDTSLLIRPLEGRIVSVSVNSQMMFRSDDDSGESFSISPWPYESWCSIKTENVKTDGTNVTMKLEFLSNLPPVNTDGGGASPDTVAEWFRAVQANRQDTSYSIGDIITGTGDRSLIVTAVTEDPSTREQYTSVYKVVQPGFASALPDISVGFTPLVRNGMIERSNSGGAGVLCNQVQFFTECRIYGFDEESWGRWFTDLTLDIELDVDKEVYRTYDDYKFTTTVNPGNIQPYDAEQAGSYGNNAVRTRFSWITPSSGITYESRISDIEDGEYRETVMRANFNGWTRLSASDRRDPGSLIYQGIDYSLMPGSGITGLTLKETAVGPVLLRIITEFANPVPAEMNFAWRAKRITVTGRLKEEFGGTDERLSFSKTCSYESENTKFIVNPISMTLAPLSEDGSLGKIRNTAGYVKFTGPDDEIKIRAGLVGLTDGLLAEYENGSPISEGLPYTAFQRIMHSIPDVSSYEPKLRYLQDNVTGIVIEPLDVRGLIKDGTLTPGNSEFVRFFAGEMLNSADTSISEYRDFLANRYNIQDFNANPDINRTFGDRFVSLFYNTDVLNPVMRSGTLSFYYNNEIYPASKYSQETRKEGGAHTPLLIRQDIRMPLRTREQYEAIKIWNREYEASDHYNEKVPFGGDLTQSGNGYVFCPESADGGQWESDHIMPLADLKESQNAFVTDFPVTAVISPADGFMEAPDAGRYFRSLVWSLGWTYPNFVEENNVTFIIPNYMCNSYEASIDASVMDLYRTVYDPKDYEEDFVGWIEENAGTDSVPTLYPDLKIRRLPGSDDDVVVRQLIPYNLLYRLTPRTAYNTDMNGVTVNVFMLQQPTIMDEFTYEFKDKPNGVDKAVRLPLSRDSYDTTKDFSYSVDRPWSFGG